MSEEKKITDTDKEMANTEQEIASASETIASTEETTKNYEVGYRRPPKNTRFQKGASGNPSGRPKRALDFFAELRREANRVIIIKEGGRSIRIPKIRAIARQATNRALTGPNSSVKTFLPLYLQAEERDTLSKAQEAKELGRFNNPNELSDEELHWLAAGGDPKELLKKRKR